MDVIARGGKFELLAKRRANELKRNDRAITAPIQTPYNVRRRLLPTTRGIFLRTIIPEIAVHFPPPPPYVWF